MGLLTDFYRPCESNACREGVAEVPLAYWLAIRMQMQSKGAFWAIVVAEGAIAGASAILFKQGRWKGQKI